MIQLDASTSSASGPSRNGVRRRTNAPSDPGRKAMSQVTRVPMAAPLHPSAAAGQRGCIPLPTPFILESGGTLEGARLAWELCGDPRKPLVAVLGGISADAHACAHAGDPRPGWWPGVAGAGFTLDPARFRLLGIDYLAGPGDSSGPGAGGRTPFPALTPGDQAAALAAVLDHLGVPRLRAIVGGSYGGMVALAFASRFPGRVECAVVLAAAHEPDPRAAAVRAIQRRIVALGLELGARDEALALARALALTTYRSGAEFRARFPGGAEITEGGEVRVAAEDYLDHQGRRFVDRLDAARFQVLSASVDLHRVDPATLGIPVTLVGFEDDDVAPPCTMRALAAQLPPGSTLTEIPSRYGHDGFLKETTAVGAVIRRALAGAAVEASR